MKSNLLSIFLFGALFIGLNNYLAYSKSAYFVTIVKFQNKNILNEPPVIAWTYPEFIDASPGKELNLTYSCSDPEFHRLNPSILPIKEKTTGKSQILAKVSLSKVSLRVPESVHKNDIYAFLLEVKDEGLPSKSTSQTILIRII